MNELDQECPVKILIVDDEENILRALSRILLEENVQILTADSGDRAIPIINDNKDIGLIISDQRMPGISGVDFLERAKRLLPNAVRIILTGYSDINAAIDAINRGGAMKYLTKPWKDEEIVQTVRDSCQKFNLIQKNKQLTAIIQRQNEELKQWSRQLEIMVQEQTIDLTKQNDMLKKLADHQRNNFKAIIRSLAGLIELRDKKVRSHSNNVSRISSKIALALGFPREEAEIVFVASQLHDIGKIGLSDFLLAKDADEFSPEEMEEYHLHPVRGQAAVDGIDDLREAGRLIRHHHEAYDGTGFPDRLKGSGIPLGSRIIAMADYVDRALGETLREDAIDHVLQSVYQSLGKRFDPELYPYLKDPVSEVCGSMQSGSGTFERELRPMDLKAGMVLSRDVCSGTGLLLLSKGMTLDTTSIQAIRRYYEIDPPKRGVFIGMKR